MELQGKVIAVLEARSGVSARGEWKAQDFVIETHDQFPRKMVFSVFGADRLAQFNIQSGEEIVVSFDIDAHEYQGRWFNSIRAWNIQRVDPAAVQAAAMGAMPQPAAFGTAPASAPVGGAQAPFPAPEADASAENSADDLPF